MSYAGVDAYRARLGKKFDVLYRDASERAESDLSQAAAEIDAYLSARYVVPVSASTSTLQLLEDWNLTLAEEKAYAVGGSDKYPEIVAKRVDAVRKALRDAADGRMRLVGAAEAGAGGAGAGGAGVTFVKIEAPMFGRENMKGY